MTDNAEHVRVLERIAIDYPARACPEETAAFTAAIAALNRAAVEASQPDPWKPSGLDYDTSIHHNPDAAAWADFFVATFPAQAGQRGLMLGWFANAMMAMHDHIHAQPKAEAVEGGEVKPLTDSEFRLAQLRGKLAWLEQCVRDAGCEIDYSEEDCVYNRRAEDAEATQPESGGQGDLVEEGLRYFELSGDATDHYVFNINGEVYALERGEFEGMVLLLRTLNRADAERLAVTKKFSQYTHPQPSAAVTMPQERPKSLERIISERGYAEIYAALSQGGKP